jgi:hypothetical protein
MRSVEHTVGGVSRHVNRDGIGIVIVGGAIIPDEGTGHKSLIPETSAHPVQVVGRNLTTASEG